MMHEYYELSIEEVVRMPREEFLEACCRYLNEVLERDKQRQIDREARAYERLITKYWGGLSVDIKGVFDDDLDLFD